MSQLIVDQKSIGDLFSNKKSNFLIPDYQRPYAWTQDECETLWEDLYLFAFPNNSSQGFDSENNEYFLGPIVTFGNSDNKQEIIDGQQRLTTIMLLLRAFYSRFETAQDDDTVETKKRIARCIWKTDEIGKPLFECLKIDSEVASDNDKDEFLSILKTGKVTSSMKSRYARNFSYFANQINEFIEKTPMYTVLFPLRILNNVILLPIEAESQDTALRIFSTLNDRGLPLSDADIFKSQFYKFFSSLERKEEFVNRWKELEENANRIFHPKQGTPVDELFTRYMYYRRALNGIKDTTTKSLRDFFGANSYAMLKDEQALSDLEALLGFWQNVDAQRGFSDEVLCRLFVLSNAPNGMWTYLVSVWFMAKRNEDNKLDEKEFLKFLDTITGFIFGYAIERPGVNALRSPVYPEMVNIVRGEPVIFENHRFNSKDLRLKFEGYTFSNNRPITKSVLTWWAFQQSGQRLLDFDTKFDIEHIYAKKRHEFEPLSNKDNLEALGNKSILEKRVNIRASDYKFVDKCKYYRGFIDANDKEKHGTEIQELLTLAAKHDDFRESDIQARTHRIIDSFINELERLGLLEG